MTLLKAAVQQSGTRPMASGATGTVYRVYGQTVQSEVPLSGFPLAEHHGTPGMIVEWRPSPTAALDEPQGEVLQNGHYHSRDGRSDHFAFYRTPRGFGAWWKGL